jgi:hypothetical protein
MDLTWKDQLATELAEVEAADTGGLEGTTEGTIPRRKSLVCKETQGQLKAETRNLERYKLLILGIGIADLLFILAAFLVIIQYLFGDIPKSGVTRLVYIIPIAGTLLGSASVAFLLNERRLARKAVADLNVIFRRVCKDA